MSDQFHTIDRAVQTAFSIYTLRSHYGQVKITAEEAYQLTKDDWQNRNAILGTEDIPVYQLPAEMPPAFAMLYNSKVAMEIVRVTMRENHERLVEYLREKHGA